MSTIRQAKHNPVVQRLGRAGMVCYGVVHLLIAWLAAQVALGDSGEQADSKGAIAEVATTSLGPVLLWALAIGLVMFALWQFVEAAAGFTYLTTRGKRTAKRIGAVARAVTALAIAVGAFQFVTGSGSTDTTGKQQTLTAKVLAMPGGQWLVGAVAVGIAITAVVIFRKGIKRAFAEELDRTELPARTWTWVERLGRVGWIGKGIAYGVIAVLVGTAAVQADPAESGGLDKALHTVAAQPYGAALLAVIALGLAAFGGYCFAAAKAHRD